MIATAGGLPEATYPPLLRCCASIFSSSARWNIDCRRPAKLGGPFAFLATALTASQLSARLKRQTKEALDRQREMERLYALSRAILLTDATQPTAKQIAHQIAHTFECPAVALYDRKSR